MENACVYDNVRLSGPDSHLGADGRRRRLWKRAASGKHVLFRPEAEPICSSIPCLCQQRSAMIGTVQSLIAPVDTSLNPESEYWWETLLSESRKHGEGNENLSSSQLGHLSTWLNSTKA